VGLVIVIAVVRLRTYDEPFERDLITYMLTAHSINHGGRLYVDTWGFRAPGSYLVYALAERLAGFGESEVYLLNVGAAVITLVGVYLAGAARGKAAGLWAAVFWVLLCGAPTVQANQPNMEVFLNACVVWALALLLRGDWVSRGPALAFGVGTLFAMATVIKQVAIVDPILLCCCHVAFAPGGRSGRLRAFRDVAIMAGIGAMTWAMLIAYFAATGRFEEFRLAVFSSSLNYSGNPLFNLYRYFRELRFLPKFLWFAAPVGALVLLGAARDRRALWGRQWALYVTALVAVQLKIVMNGTGFLPHYYQYWLPMLAIGAGWAAGPTSPRLGKLPHWALPAAGAAVAALLLVEQGRYYLLPGEEWSRLKYGASVAEMRALGRGIGGLLQSGETFYQHGNNPELYYYAARRPPSFLLWIAYLNDGDPSARMVLERHLAALAEAPPDLIVVAPDERLWRSSKREKPGLIGRLFARESIDEGRDAQAVLDTLLPNYRSIEIEALRDFPKFKFYVLRGSTLNRRLRGEGPDSGSSPDRAGDEEARSDLREVEAIEFVRVLRADSFVK
jgi:hypothetical protein